MLWIALIKRTQIYTLHEPLLRYRIRGNDANLSQNPANLRRTNFEMIQVYRSFFDEIPEDLFREAFFDDLRDPCFTGAAVFALEKALVYFKHSNPAIRQIGMEKLFTLLQDEALVRLARDRYGLRLPDYYQ